jgi:hypothetical protein
MSKMPQHQQAPGPWSDTIKDPDELHTLASEAGEEVESELTKAEASKRIDELQKKTGRGQP